MLPRLEVVVIHEFEKIECAGKLGSFLQDNIFG